MNNVAEFSAKDERERLRARLLGGIAELHCGTAALHGFAMKDLSQLRMDDMGRLDQDRITDLQAQAELVSQKLADIARINTTMRHLPSDAEPEAQVPVYPLARVRG